MFGAFKNTMRKKDSTFIVVRIGELDVSNFRSIYKVSYVTSFIILNMIDGFPRAARFSLNPCRLMGQHRLSNASKDDCIISVHPL